MNLQVVLETANLPERLFAVFYVANEQLVHPQGLRVLIVGHRVEAIVN